jgi:hypothetical protein
MVEQYYYFIPLFKINVHLFFWALSLALLLCQDVANSAGDLFCSGKINFCKDLLDGTDRSESYPSMKMDAARPVAIVNIGNLPGSASIDLVDSTPTQEQNRLFSVGCLSCAKHSQGSSMRSSGPGSCFCDSCSILRIPLSSGSEAHPFRSPVPNP